MSKLLSDIGLTPEGVSAAVLGRLEDVPAAGSGRRALGRGRA